MEIGRSDSKKIFFTYIVISNKHNILFLTKNFKFLQIYIHCFQIYAILR